jgi:hypothetical protein
MILGCGTMLVLAGLSVWLLVLLLGLRRAIPRAGWRIA